MKASGYISALDAKTGGPVPIDDPLIDVDMGTYWDDVNGGYLDAKLVQAARAEIQSAPV